MRAKKENKVYDIDRNQMQSYLDQGFDIYDNEGNVIEYTPLKKISYTEHLKKMKAADAEKDKIIDSLKTELESKKELSAENVFDLLKEYAEEKGIDVGASTSANGVLTKILEVEKE